jgi:hypothetical protein
MEGNFPPLHFFNECSPLRKGSHYQANYKHHKLYSNHHCIQYLHRKFEPFHFVLLHFLLNCHLRHGQLRPIFQPFSIAQAESM